MKNATVLDISKVPRQDLDEFANGDHESDEWQAKWSKSRARAVVCGSITTEAQWKNLKVGVAAI